MSLHDLKSVLKLIPVVTVCSLLSAPLMADHGDKIRPDLIGSLECLDVARKLCVALFEDTGVLHQVRRRLSVLVATTFLHSFLRTV